MYREISNREKRHRSGRKVILCMVRSARHARGLTQQELADYVGISRKTLSGIETGKSFSNLFDLILIAEALHKPLDELYKLNPLYWSHDPVLRRGYIRKE
jgi:putative transcriptional regulator